MQRLLQLGILLTLGACASVQPDPITLEYEGVFQAASGPEDPLYCYCDAPAYINACGNVRIPLCLEKNSGLEHCTNVLIKGYYQYFQANLPGQGECPDPEAEMRLLVVTEWECRD